MVKQTAATGAAVAEKQNSRVGEMISGAMAEQGLSTKDMSDKLELTYEHVRRIVKGEGVPSKYILKAFCEILGLDYVEAYKAMTADQIEKKYGGVPAELSGKNPELEPIERAWHHLTAEQKADAISMITGWSKRNRSAARR
jgi:transcriptional regulator with XRE-family HTH domain